MHSPASWRPSFALCTVDKVLSIAVLSSLVILTVHFPHCESHLASLLKAGDGLPKPLPPFLNYIQARVSRDPSVGVAIGQRSDNDNLDLPLSHSSRVNYLTNPFMPLRFRPNRFVESPKFHHYIPLNGGMGSNIVSNTNLGEDPSIFESAAYNSNRRDEDDEGKQAGGLESGSKSLELDSNSNSDFNLDSLMTDSEKESPTFTPLISAQALTNMEKFFTHLQENLMAMQQDGNLEIGQPERRRMTSDQSFVKNSPQDSSPESKGAFQTLRWVPAAFHSGTPSSSLPSSSFAPSMGRGDGERSRMNFISPPTLEESERRRAKGYNPRHLWTNMGLGKK